MAQNLFFHLISVGCDKRSASTNQVIGGCATLITPYFSGLSGLGIYVLMCLVITFQVYSSALRTQGIDSAKKYIFGNYLDFLLEVIFIRFFYPFNIIEILQRK